MNCASAIRILLAGVTLVFLAGCQHDRLDVAVEEAPYQLVEGKYLRVREDLIQNLKFAQVEKSDLTAEITGLAHVTFAPGAAYALRVPFEGFVETVYVEVGEIVQENQVLATIRSSELAKLRSELQRVLAELHGEEDSLKRAQGLFTSGAASERRIVELQVKIRSLEAQRNGIRQSMAAARANETGDDILELRAPRGGHVISRRIDPGEQAEDPENVPAFLIADPTRLVLRAQFPERDAPLLKEGFSCRILVPSLGDTMLSGKVLSVVKAIDPRNRSVEAVCVFDSIETRLRAEMLARVTVSVRGEPTLVVPRSAILLRRDARVVLVRRGTRDLERRTVEIGNPLDTKQEILLGLKAGDEVVVDGAVLLDGELDQLF